MMSNWLTDHVRSIRPDQFPDVDFWFEFEALVRNRMRRRGLLDSPPRFLGYIGQQWDDMFQDVVFDCYQFAVLDRLVGLQTQLTIKPNVDGLILRNIDFFLLERQRQNDRLGYAVFRNLESALQAALQAGEIQVAGRRENRIRNETLLRLRWQEEAPTSTVEQIRQAVHSASRWQENLPELARIGDRAQQVLREGLVELAALQIVCCRFKDLVDVLKEEVRSVLGISDPQLQDSQELEHKAAVEFIRLVRTRGGGSRYEENEQFEDRVRRIRAALTSLEKRSEVVRRVDRLFLELVAIAESEEPFPSQAELARRIGLPKSSLSDYMQLIRSVWKQVDASFN